MGAFIFISYSYVPYVLSGGVPVWGNTTSANDGVLTLKAGNNTKTFSANQSTNETFEITAADLGITGPMEFIGISTTNPQVSGATIANANASETTVTMGKTDATVTSNYSSCDCNCHAGGIKAFFFNLTNFFAKLFYRKCSGLCNRYN